MISTSFISGTGFIKCIPDETIRSWWRQPVLVIDMDEMFVAR